MTCVCGGISAASTFGAPPLMEYGAGDVLGDGAAVGDGCGAVVEDGVADGLALAGIQNVPSDVHQP